jgi:hypothetical protein
MKYTGVEQRKSRLIRKEEELRLRNTKDNKSVERVSILTWRCPCSLEFSITGVNGEKYDDDEFAKKREIHEARIRNHQMHCDVWQPAIWNGEEK